LDIFKQKEQFDPIVRCISLKLSNYNDISAALKVGYFCMEISEL